MSGTDFYYDQQIMLAERLAKLAPMSGTNRVFFTNSGAEAIEAAFKLARHQTGRQHVIAFWGAFHGRTFGAMSLSGSKAVHRQRFMPMVPQITHVTYPNPYRPSGSHAAGIARRLHHQRDRAARSSAARWRPEEVAAIFVEPIQGEGGYIVPPADFLPRLRELCDRHGILLVCDEVQCGMGRTGKMWAVQHVGVEPDIVATAKGHRQRHAAGRDHRPRGDHELAARARTPRPSAATRSACAAALATLDLLEAGLMDNAATVGAHLMREAARGAGGVSGHRRRPRRGADGRRRFRGGPGEPPSGRRRDAEPRHRRSVSAAGCCCWAAARVPSVSAPR